MKTTLFIPVKNEITGIQEIMPKIDQGWVDEVVVVDGQSTDGTKAWFLDRGYSVVDQTTAGIGGAYWDCLAHATGDIIIAFSPDGNSLPELIPVLRDRMAEGRDMVIASRYRDGAKSDDDDKVTAFGNWMFTKIVNMFFGGSYTDTLVMLRAFRKDLPERLGMAPTEYPVFEYVLSIRCAKQSAEVLEIPGDEPSRLGDVRKMKPLYNGTALLLVALNELIPIRDWIPEYLWPHCAKPQKSVRNRSVHPASSKETA
ncbi:glycosyltransferase family 2 protein [Elusimicrobiota bacterium]